MIKRCFYRLFYFVLCGLFVSCSQNVEEGDDSLVTPDIKYQDICFYISSNQDVVGSMRDVPPGSDDSESIPGTCNVNKIALLTFRRLVGTDSPFLFDKDNSVVFDQDGKIQKGADNRELVCEDSTDGSEVQLYQKKALGKIKKQNGYEYKIIALGYNTNRKDDYPSEYGEFDERDCFKIVAENGSAVDESTSLSEVKLKLIPFPYSDISTDLAGNSKDQITGAWLRTPEIFFANCSADDGETIQFGDTKAITGVLKRGVAQIILNISNLQDVVSLYGRHACQFSFLADKLNTEVYLENYDCFLQPSVFQGAYSSDYTGSFTAMSGEGTGLNDKNTISFTVYVLPTVTSLRVRYLTAYDTPDPMKKVFDSDIAVTSLSDGNQATGIIDPVGGGKTFYIRRNHRYVINGTGEQIKKNDN